MYTQCRGCGEIFAVLVDELVTASAMVRCSSCGTVFNSLDTLSDYKPQESADLMLHDNDNPPPLLTHEFKSSVVTENSIKQPGLDTEREIFDEEDEISENPDFVAEIESKKSSKSSLLWGLLTFILALFLLWQASEAIKNGSIKLAEGNFKNKICGQIECYSADKQTNVNKIALVSRSIRQHAGRDNALIITTGIINSDENVQNFPALEVKMSNLNGEIVAMRRFLPSEYIDDKNIAAGMLPNVLVPVTLELQSPGKNAVTFEVGFSPTFGAH